MHDQYFKRWLPLQVRCSWSTAVMCMAAPKQPKPPPILCAHNSHVVKGNSTYSCCWFRKLNANDHMHRIPQHITWSNVGKLLSSKISCYFPVSFPGLSFNIPSSVVLYVARRWRKRWWLQPVVKCTFTEMLHRNTNSITYNTWRGLTREVMMFREQRWLGQELWWRLEGRGKPSGFMAQIVPTTKQHILTVSHTVAQGTLSASVWRAPGRPSTRTWTLSRSHKTPWASNPLSQLINTDAALCPPLTISCWCSRYTECLYESLQPTLPESLWNLWLMMWNFGSV